VQIREDAIYQALKEQIEHPTKDEVREVIRTIKIISHQERTISVQKLSSVTIKNYGK